MKMSTPELQAWQPRGLSLEISFFDKKSCNLNVSASEVPNGTSTSIRGREVPFPLKLMLAVFDSGLRSSMLLSYNFVRCKRNDVISSPPIMLHGTSQFFLILQTAQTRRQTSGDPQAIARKNHFGDCNRRPSRRTLPCELPSGSIQASKAQDQKRGAALAEAQTSAPVFCTWMLGLAIT